jgi:hypothetical protein
MFEADLLQENILTLGMRADELRRAASGQQVRYQRVHLLTAAQIRDGLVVPEPASEVRMRDVPASLEEAESLARAITEAAGARPVHLFSLADLIDRAPEWGGLHQVLTRIAACGVADVAELPVDRIADLRAAIGAARRAGLAASRLMVERPLEDKLELIERMIAGVREAGGIERVAPLSREAPVDKPTTGYDDVRVIALTRIALHAASAAAGRRPAIAVDWLRYGPKLAQVALTFGADFLDAVPATSDESLGRRRATVEEVERNIRAAGFEPEEFRR